MSERDVDALAQEGLDVARHVVVGGERLALGLRARVHEHERRAAARRELGQRGVAQPADVVEHHRPGLQGGARHLGLPGVDRDADTLGREALDERDDARGLLVRRRGGAVGDARLGADVDEVRALGDELEPALDLALERVQAHGVGERVRAGVDDPHDQRAPGPHVDGAVAQAQGAHSV